MSATSRLSRARSIARTIDDLYAGAVDDDAWRRGLGSFASLFGGLGPYLVSLDPVTGQVYRDQCYDIDPRHVAEYGREWLARDQRFHVAMASPAGRTFTEIAMLGRRAWERTALYNEFLLPADCPWALSSILQKSRRRLTAISVQGTRNRGPFGEDDIVLSQRLLEHVTRAIQVKDRVELMRSGLEATASGMAPGVDSLTLDARGRILAATRGAFATLEAAGCIAASRGRTPDWRGPQGEQIAGVIASHRGTQGRTAAERVGALALDAPGGAAGGRIGLTLMRSPGSAPLWFTEQPYWLLCIQRKAQSPKRDPFAFAMRFDLTPRQSQIATILADGSTPVDIARQLDLSLHTVRNQLKRIFDRTGARTQAQLVSLLLQPPSART